MFISASSKVFAVACPVILCLWFWTFLEIHLTKMTSRSAQIRWRMLGPFFLSINVLRLRLSLYPVFAGLYLCLYTHTTSQYTCDTKERSLYSLVSGHFFRRSACRTHNPWWALIQKCHRQRCPFGPVSESQLPVFWTSSERPVELQSATLSRNRSVTCVTVDAAHPLLFPHYLAEQVWAKSTIM